ncbi:MAG: DsrE family protein [Christensenella sp.]
MKAIFHVNESIKWNAALANVGNLIRYSEQTGVETEVEIVVNGDAVRELQENRARDNGRYDAIRELALEAVKFIACRNALAEAGIRESSLIPFVEVAASGIAELVKKQQEGFAYIKP